MISSKKLDQGDAAHHIQNFVNVYNKQAGFEFKEGSRGDIGLTEDKKHRLERIVQSLLDHE